MTRPDPSGRKARVIDLGRARASMARLDQLAVEHPELVTTAPPDPEAWERTLQEVGLADDEEQDEDMADPTPTTYGLEEVAAIVGVHVETIRRAIRAGELKAAKLPRNFRVSRVELIRWWASRGGGQLFPEAEDEPTPEGG